MNQLHTLPSRYAAGAAGQPMVVDPIAPLFPTAAAGYEQEPARPTRSAFDVDDDDWDEGDDLSPGSAVPGATVFARGGGQKLQGFQEAAQSTAETVTTLLNVDGCVIVRMFGSRLVCLTAAPEFGISAGQELDASGEAHLAPLPGGRSPEFGTPGHVARVVAGFVGATGFAAAGIHSADGDQTGVLVVFKRLRLEGDPDWFSRLMRYHADTLGQALDEEIDAVELGRDRDARNAKRLCMDDLTRLPDRRAWGMLLNHEDDRARALGHPAAVLIIDTGDTHSSRRLRKFADVLKATAGSAPALCRLDERMWGVVVTGHDNDELTALAYEIGQALRAAGARPAIGGAQRTQTRDLAAAWSLADERVFASRRAGAEKG